MDPPSSQGKKTLPVTINEPISSVVLVPEWRTKNDLPTNNEKKQFYLPTDTYRPTYHRSYDHYRAKTPLQEADCYRPTYRAHKSPAHGRAHDRRRVSSRIESRRRSRSPSVRRSSKRARSTRRFRSPTPPPRTMRRSRSPLRTETPTPRQYSSKGRTSGAGLMSGTNAAPVTERAKVAFKFPKRAEVVKEAKDNVLKY